MASLDSLFEAAKAIQAKAYAPYSRFKVGAAIAHADGRIFAGCNVENAAYPVGSCAEAGAISAMIAAGESRIAEIVVMGDGDNLVTPCGGCRQRIREFAAPRRRSISRARKASGGASRSTSCCPSPSDPTTWRIARRSEDCHDEGRPAFRPMRRCSR